MRLFDISDFVATHVTGRQKSLLSEDWEVHFRELARGIDGKSILVIGGAGTIGASFIKAALCFRPSRLYVVDIDENGLTELTRDLRSSHSYVPKEYKTYAVGLRSDILERLLVREGPFDIVANFAAHKHVRSERDSYTIQAMIENNVISAHWLLESLARRPPEHFFCVSTDKAADPVSMMGASKRLMEELVKAYSTEIQVTTARFANVAFSHGSLLDGFLMRLLKRQPIAAPMDIRRYFVTTDEAGQLCMLACILGRSGEILFPRLPDHQTRSFADIAVALLNTFGFEPDYCATEDEAKEKATSLLSESRKYPVYLFDTDTSGEKEMENFYTSSEVLDLQRFRALGVILPETSRTSREMSAVMNQLQVMFSRPDLHKIEIVQYLRDQLPDFQHSERDKGLDEKM